MKLSLAKLETVLTAIHQTPHQLVLEFAGAGAGALAWLHGVGGSSRTVLEATDRYAYPSLVEAIGFQPKQVTSSDVAQALARGAFKRARNLAGSDTPVIGLGCTATIATDRAKRGDHRCQVAVCDSQGVQTYSLTMIKGRRNRLEEENLVSLLILRAIADAVGVAGLPEPDLIGDEVIEVSFEPVAFLRRFVNGDVDWVSIAPDGKLSANKTLPGIAILSGSFNPLHDGHRQLVQVVGEMVGQPIYFELPLVNADKAPIALLEARRRSTQFAGYATLIYTRARLFDEKAALFPNSIFILGADTAERLVQLRFYNDDPAQLDAALNSLKTAGCRIYVAGRLQGETFLTLKDLDLPHAYQDLFEEIPSSRFRVDISSSQLRAMRSSTNS
jgi:hypothetical protein